MSPAEDGDLVVAEGVDVGDVLAALAEHVDLGPDGRQRLDRTFVDSFDGLARAAGVVVARVDDGGIARLTLREPDGIEHAADVAPARTDRILAGELPRGALRDRLTDLLDARALLPVARVRSTFDVHAVRNRDAKTVARVVVEQPVLVRPGRRSVTLSTRVRVSPVRGYERSRARVTTLLTSHAGLQAGAALVDDAAAAAGTTPPARPELSADLDRGMPAAAAGLTVCRRLADVVDDNFAGTVADLDIEFLHDLRVAVRRSRSVLRELKAVLPADGLQAQRDALKWVQQVTGPTRDLDVQLWEWPGDGDERLEPLRELLRQRRAAELAAMKRALRGRRFREVWAAWRAYLDSPVEDGPDLGDVAAARIDRLYRRMVRDGNAIDEASPPEALHELRKRGKELRYLLEFFGGLWPERAVKPLVSTLKKLQDVLGQHQDRHVQADELRRLAPDLARVPGGADALLALGPMLERLEAEQQEARDAFAERFARFADRDVRSTVKATFR